MAEVTRTIDGGTGEGAAAVPSSYGRFCRNWRMRVKDRIVHPLMGDLWPEMLAVDSCSREELLALQSRRKEELLRDVVEHVPFYRDWAAKAGGGPGGLPAWDELPVVTKQDYRENPARFQSDRFPTKEMHRGRTSGSSGEPFELRQHRSSTDRSYCALWRALARHGLRPGDRRAYVWGRSFRFAAGRLAILKIEARLRVRNWLNNTLVLNAYDLSPRHIEVGIERLQAFAPVYLHGYVSALYTIARAMLDRGASRGSWAPRLVVTESEALYDFQRRAMEQAFGCRVVEHYGSVEFGNIAQQDPSGRLRINDDLYVVETGPSGEALVTNLFSHAYPFIRYRQGDVLTLAEETAPGLPYTVLSRVEGRIVDRIALPGGGFVHGVALAHVIDPHLGLVRRYQIRQTGVGAFRVVLAVDRPLPGPVKATIAEDLRGLVGASARIDFEEVSEIATSDAGKHRWVVSDVHPNEMDLGPLERPIE